MAREEIIKRIRVLNDRRFLLAMKDHWTREDFDKDREMSNEIFELERSL